MPYLPATLAPIAGFDAPPEALKSLIKQVKMEVLIADRYDAPAKSKLKTILIKTLALDEARGDTIAFSSLGLAVERPESEIARQLTSAEAEARELRAQLDNVGRERDDAKRELTQIKEENDQFSKSDARFWRDNAAVLIAAVLVLVALSIGGFAVRGAAGKLSEAVQSIGSGIPILGEKLGESLAQKPQTLLPATGQPSRGESFRDGEFGARASLVGPAMSLEVVAKRVIELHQELSEGLSGDSESAAIEYISRLLEDQVTVERAVATMELLGKDRANQLYARLGSVQQEKVFAFLKSGRYSKPKGEVMLEAGEALKSRIFAASFEMRVRLSDRVSERLLLLGSDDQGAVARMLEGEALARFFLYLEPAGVSAVCAYLREKDVVRFEKIGQLLVKVPEVETADHLDNEVLSAIETQLSKIDTDVQAPYLSYYRRIVETSDDDLAEAIVELLSSANPRVERFMRESVVTFGTFFKLHGDIQEEILADMDNKTLAALVGPLKPEHKTAIFAHVEDRRKDLVEEEVDRLNAKGARQMVAAHKMAKQQVSSRIVQIKGNSPLSDLLARKLEGLPSAGTSGGSRAA